MQVQALVVAALVIACTVYAVWTLMPSALRRTVSRWALKLPLPAVLNGPSRRATQAAPGCGACGDCGGASKPIRIHRRG